MILFLGEGGVSGLAISGKVSNYRVALMILCLGEGISGLAISGNVSNYRVALMILCLGEGISGLAISGKGSNGSFTGIKNIAH